MEKSRINLNHFEFKIIKNKSGDRLQTIAVTSKALYEKLYKDVSLDYIFQSESKFANIDSQNNIIINKINTTQERSLIATIHARLKRAIKDKEESEPKSDNLDDLFSDDFDFSELDIVDENTTISVDDFDFDDDVLSKDFNSVENLIDPKHLNDDFNIDDLDDTEPTPKIVGNESTAVEVFPKDFDFDKHSDSLISEMLQYDKEIYEVFKESQRILEQKNKLQLQYDNLVKKGDWIYD
ncbi:hypothetical protein GIV63_31740, partial [Pseudomonas sp. PA-3-10C]|uniref:hypothetical protein n=1 Tax=Pseudomonas sp. PA-3-10C TaxID=2665471 RepID=UPI001F4741E6